VKTSTSIYPVIYDLIYDNSENPIRNCMQIWTRQDYLVSSCLWCKQIVDKSSLFSVVLNILETERFLSSLHAVWTRLLTSPSCKLENGSRQKKTLFTPHFETRQNSHDLLVANSVHNVDTDKTVLSCPYRRCWCELGIRYNLFRSTKSVHTNKMLQADLSFMQSLSLHHTPSNSTNKKQNT